MRFMMLVIPKGYEKAAPGTVPDAKLVERMTRCNQELTKAAASLTRNARERDLLLGRAAACAPGASPP